MDITIRKINNTELDALYSIRMDLLKYFNGGTPMTEEFGEKTFAFLKKHFEDNTMYCLIAESDGKIITTVLTCLYDYIPTVNNFNGKMGYISNVFTLPEYRGQGIARKVVDAAIAAAKELGVEQLHLRAEIPAIPLYERIGFSVDKQHMSIMLNTSEKKQP